MSIASSDQSNRTTRPRAVPGLPQEAFDDREWDERLAREVRHQKVIEATFDRAEAYARVGDSSRRLNGSTALPRSAAACPGRTALYAHAGR